MMETIQQGHRFNEAFATIGFGRFQISVFFYAILGSLAEAMQLTLLTYVGPATEAHFNLNRSKENLIAIMTYTGMIIGAYLWSAVSNYSGRKRGILGSALVTSIAVMISCASPNFITFLILRFIAGLGLGGASVLTTWGAECVPNLGKLIAMISLFVSYSIGTTMEASIARFVVPSYGWRVLLGLSSLPHLLALLFYACVPESPVFLKNKGRVVEAMEVLKSAAALNKKALTESLDVPLISAENMATKTESSQEREQIPEGRSEIKRTLGGILKLILASLLRLASSTWRKSSLQLWVLYFLNNYSYYVIILLVSDVQKQDANDPKFYGNAYTIIFTELFGLCLAVALMVTLGRKLTGVNMVAIGFILFYIQTIDLCTVISTHIFVTTILISASLAIVQIYAEEVYPRVSHTAGIGIATAAGRFGSLALPLIAAALNDDKHKSLAAIPFALKILLSGVCALKLHVETE